ncbi:zinc-binding dehydrogenase [Kitasatospora sp. NPDC004745]|uniref:zinc-binding dehydrogenase n=1 Tax=Kitasatospora sp. NPDC004745 TaxID=3364019 RepID=UPI0036CDB7DC
MRKAGALDAGSLERIAELIRSGELTVPIAATFPVERIREAVVMQAERHVHGKLVIAL